MVEMRGIALDTNAAIALLNGISSIQDTLRNYDIVFLPATVVGELLFGAKNSQRKAANLKKFRVFIDTCEVLGVNELIADTYSDIRLELKQKGKPLPENDIWIAATCLVHNVPLMSFDKHFLEIPQLSLITAIEE